MNRLSNKICYLTSAKRGPHAVARDDNYAKIEVIGTTVFIYIPVAYLECAKRGLGGLGTEVPSGSPAGSMGKALVGRLGDEVPQRLIFWLKNA